MRAQAYTSSGLWQRTKWIRWAYVAGLVSGILVGWLLHGIISLFVRFGLVALLLLPLIIILYLFWRSSRGNGRTTVMTWTSGTGIGANGGPSVNGDGRIRPDANGVYDLDALLREQEQQR